MIVQDTMQYLSQLDPEVGASVQEEFARQQRLLSIIGFEFVFEGFNHSVTKFLRRNFRPDLRGIKLRVMVTPLIVFVFTDFLGR